LRGSYYTLNITSFPSVLPTAHVILLWFCQAISYFYFQIVKNKNHPQHHSDTVMKNIRLVLLISTLALGSRSNAQTVPPLLQSMLDNVLDSMHTYINNKSLSASIQLPSEAIWARASGISSVVPFANVTTADSYQIGSITKTLTAGCVLHLIDQGLLGLDDSLHQWIDTITYVNPDITIRQLLRHQTGLYNYVANPSFEPTLYSDMDSVWTPEAVVTTFIQPPPGVPGGAFSYCNTNYMLLAMVIESVTGNPYYTEIRNRFLTPLGLPNLAIPSMEPFSSPVAHVWLDMDGDGTTDDAHSFFFNYLSYNSAAGAAGAYYGTPSELTQWMRSYMREEFHTPSIMAEAKTTIPASGMPIIGYGLGMMKKSFAGYIGLGHGGDVVYSASSW
jgi:D-alanyl-D-alanine carboxypeptidase